MLTLKSFKLEDIAFSAMERVRYASAAAKRAAALGKELSRKIYTDGKLYYKVWPDTYRLHRRLYVRGSQVEIPPPEEGNEDLLGLQYKLYNEKTASALVGQIHGPNGALLGYVTKSGTPLTRDEIEAPETISFVEELIETSLQAGYVLRDVHAGNFLRGDDGKLSLIDLETPVADIYSLDLQEETQSGSLRRGTSAIYRRFILSLFDVRDTSQRMLSFREKLSMTPELPLPASSELPSPDLMSVPNSDESTSSIRDWIADKKARLKLL